MDPEQQLALLKQATAATVRALGGLPQALVDYSAREAPAAFAAGEAERVRLAMPAPALLAASAAADKTAFRGMADQIACTLRYHDRALHAALRPQAQPASGVFDALEKARTDVLGAAAWPGVQKNLQAVLASTIKNYQHDYGNDLKAWPLPALLSLQFLQVAAPALVPAHVAVPPPNNSSLQRLQETLHDQAAFAQQAQAWLEELGLLASPNSELDAGENKDNQTESDTGNQAQDAGEKPQEDVQEQSMPSEPAGDMRTLADTTAAEEKHAQEANSAEPEAPAGADEANMGPDGIIPYRIYTTSFDETGPVAELAQDDELTRLRHLLDRQLEPYQGLVARLAARLQRQLLAQQNRSWIFDVEEGLLNSARLPRLVMDPTTRTLYKQELEAPFRDTVVTLLLDNSGSMRGRPITLAALSADILARTLERCGVKVEILGFTTRAWKGGRAREAWLGAGKPALPGRLNEIRHIIYKSADEPYRRARKNLGLMLREGLLKENIDGEALLWAAERLLARREQRKILMVISDGAPVDDATLAANPSMYLEQHLHAVINWLQEKTPLELLAIGIGHDVTRYYKKAVTIAEVEQLGATMTKELSTLFKA